MRILLAILLFALSGPIWATEAPCEAHLSSNDFSSYSDALTTIITPTDESVYKSVLSKDTTYIDSIARIDREKSFPQKNMRQAEKSDRYWVDQDYDAHNLYRRRVFAADSHRVYRHMRNKKAEAEKAGREILDDLLETLPEKYPNRFSKNGRKLYDHISKEYWDLDSKLFPPMVIAGLILGEDLILLEQLKNGQFRMVAGFLANPSSWSLERHLGNSLRKIHADEEPRLVQMIEKAVANLKAQDRTSLRNGWQLTRYPHYGQFPYIEETEEETTGRITGDNVQNTVHLRSEMQTISLLPKSDLMLFTIKVFQYDLETISRNPEVAQAIINGVKINIEQDHYDFPHPKLVIQYLQQRAE